MTTDQKHCIPCEGMTKPLDKKSVEAALKPLNAWQASQDHQSISKDFHFKNYYQTMAFVNAVAWMAHYENHHPNLEVGYNHCLVRYSTHAIHGLSENDFICASKVDTIFQPFYEKFYDRK